MGVNSLPKTVTLQRRDCDLNPGTSVSESSTLTTRLPSHLRWRSGIVSLRTPLMERVVRRCGATAVGTTVDDR